MNTKINLLKYTVLEAMTIYYEKYIFRFNTKYGPNSQVTFKVICLQTHVLGVFRHNLKNNMC